MKIPDAPKSFLSYQQGQEHVCVRGIAFFRNISCKSFIHDCILKDNACLYMVVYVYLFSVLLYDNAIAARNCLHYCRMKWDVEYANGTNQIPLIIPALSNRDYITDDNGYNGVCNDYQIMAKTTITFVTIATRWW